MNNFKKIVSVITLLVFLKVSFALAADQVFFYYTDPAGTPLAMSDSSGAVVWRADYMPFGEETIDVSTVQNNKMFVGKEKDSESGFYYFGARYMDAMAGRFISPDVIGPIDPRIGQVNQKMLRNPQLLNRYTYALNNPYKFMDPDGKEVTRVNLPGLTRNDSTVSMRPYWVDTKMADSVVGFVNEARQKFSQLSVNNIYRIEDSSTINTDNTTANGLSRHQAGTAIDLNGVGTLSDTELQSLNEIAEKYHLSPLVDQAGDLPHFDRDPTAIGYKSLKDAVEINKQDYIFKTIRFQSDFSN